MPWCSDPKRQRAKPFAGLAGAVFVLLLLAGCGKDPEWHDIDVSDSSPPLAFTMTRASDGQTVTQANYRGHVVLLYFGYTYCPDLCPTTLSNISTILQRLGPQVQDVKVLFVTVDPNRDTLPVLASYVKDFAPEIDGLRGTPDQLAELARRYRVVYSVTPAGPGGTYEVAHSSVLYVFDATGKARLLVPSLATTSPDLAGATADLQRLIAGPDRPGFLARLWSLV
jgi:protein SCO1